MAESPAPELDRDDVPPGTVHRAGRWTVANKGGDLHAVSSRCRHQLADLSNGSLDAAGCLVCPWHGSRYDLETGAMVEGPHGFLWYVGKTPGYSQLIRAYANVLRLRTATVVRIGRVLRVES